MKRNHVAMDWSHLETRPLCIPPNLCTQAAKYWARCLTEERHRMLKAQGYQLVDGTWTDKFGDAVLRLDTSGAGTYANKQLKRWFVEKRHV